MTSPSPLRNATGARGRVAAWHAGTGLALLALVGGLMLVADPSVRTLAAPAVLAAGGLAGWALLRAETPRASLLPIWALAAAAGSAGSGGPTFAVGALALLWPILAGLELRAPLRGVVAALVACAAALVLAPRGVAYVASSPLTFWGLLAATVGAAIFATRKPEPALSPAAVAEPTALSSAAVAEPTALSSAAVAEPTALSSAAVAEPMVAPSALPPPHAPAVAPPPAALPAEPPQPVADEMAALREELAQAHVARERAEGEARARAAFLANMSHELRTPLNAVIGFSDIMRQRLFGPLPERYAEYAELIHESGGHLLALINDVLDISKLDADRYELKLERLDAREPVNAALRLMRRQAEEKGVRLRASLPAQALPIDADPRALKQIALNLLSNALKFTPPAGEVDVTLGEAAGELELSVADTGVGIAADDLARLGQPYAQAEAGRAAGGTGLGLSLVKALAALHGGRVMFESRLGEGTAAAVRLPVLVREAA